MPYVADDLPLPCVATANLAKGGSQPYPPDGGVEPMQVGEVAREAGRRRHGARPLRQKPPFIDADVYR